jgi:hypothetical protein
MDLFFRDIEEADISTCLSIMQKNYDELNDNSFYSRAFMLDIKDVFVKDGMYNSNCRICMSGPEIV